MRRREQEVFLVGVEEHDQQADIRAPVEQRLDVLLVAEVVEGLHVLPDTEDLEKHGGVRAPLVLRSQADSHPLAPEVRG